jgi:hypothetical protein
MKNTDPDVRLWVTRQLLAAAEPGHGHAVWQ